MPSLNKKHLTNAILALGEQALAFRRLENMRLEGFDADRAKELEDSAQYLRDIYKQSN